MVSEERYKASRRDPYVKIKEIHVGYIHVDLEAEFVMASEQRKKINLGEVNGIPIILNPLCEGSYQVIYDTAEISIGGIKPSKSWLKRYGLKIAKNK